MYGTMDNSYLVDADRIPTTDVLGFRRRRLVALKRLDWLFLVTSTVSLVVVAGLTIQRIVVFAPVEGSKYESATDFAFAMVLFINTVFCLYYVYSGVFRERFYEMLMFMAGILVVLVYCIFNMAKPQKPGTSIDPVKIARLVIAGIFGPINFVLALFMVRSFGWLEFRVVGASETMQKMYRQRSLCYSFISFDVQAAASFLALCMSDGKPFQILRILLIVLGIPLSLVWAFLGGAAISSEKKLLCLVWAAFGFIVPAFVVFRLIRDIVDFSSGKEHVKENLYFFAAVIIVGLITLAVRIALFAIAYLTSRNFGKGLKTQVFNVSAIQEGVVELNQLLCCRLC